MPILQMRKLRPERATPGGGSQDGDAALQTWRPVAVLLKSQAGLGQDRIQRLSLVLIGLTRREITDSIFMSSNPVCIPGLTSYSSSPLSPVAYIIFLLSLLTSSSPPLTSELCFPEHPPLVCREGSAQPQGDRQSQRPQWYCLYLLDFRQGGTTIFEISYLAGRIVKFVSSQNKLNCDFCFMKKKKKSDR